MSQMMMIVFEMDEEGKGYTVSQANGGCGQGNEERRTHHFVHARVINVLVDDLEL